MKKNDEMTCLRPFIHRVLLSASILTVLGSAGVATASDNGGSGIFNLRSQSPMQSLRMVTPFQPAGTIRPGWQLLLTATLSNVWAQESSYAMDYEMADVQAIIGYGFSQRLELAAGYDNRAYYGGVLDGFIQGFHDLFGIDQNGRDEVPKGQSRVVRTDIASEESDADVFNNSGLSLMLKYDAFAGSRWLPAINMSGSVRYGLDNGKAFKNNHPVDYGFSLGFGKRFSERWYTHLIFSYTIFDLTVAGDFNGFTPIRMENQQAGGLLSFGYEYSPRWTFLGQYMVQEAAIKDISGLDEPSHEIHFGVKYSAPRRGTFEFAIIQNIVSMDNSPDFGIHLGWTYPF
ncbi:DUF3187 family protein [Desulfuromonas sp. AOP6]|uniref:DUF3187 family protein n=1 Tax=Desulfuromonas sp. AOP6 TaxID=1566351 RepID=UPI0012DF28D8|nr:DUF3187 family protein [Desulfuromonas sp. AOP6]